jgi:hypothetical protein
MRINTRTVPWDTPSEHFESLGSEWVYRGQRDAGWDLTTSLERHGPEGRTLPGAEAELLRQFKRRAHVYLAPHHIASDTGEWLALMQHFGAPTRLLDVTRSRYVAAYLR